MAASGPATAGPPGGKRRAVVEYYRAVGGLPQRALLGGTWQADASGLLRVEVEAAGRTLTTSEASCITPLGKKLVPGLADEFADDVASTLLRGIPQSGLLRVDRAAHHPVDSSRIAFRAVAGLLVAVLLVNGPADTEAAVRRTLSSLTRTRACVPGVSRPSSRVP